jgi:single-strand DNA-binding protein
MNINKVIVVGNLVREAELKTTQSGAPVTKLVVATNRQWKDRDGNKQEDAEFHNIITFGKTAENCDKYLEKGQQVMVEGRIQTRSWEQDGQKKYMTEIVAENVQFGSKPRGLQGEETQQVKQVRENEQERRDTPDTRVAEQDRDITPDSIPF